MTQPEDTLDRFMAGIRTAESGSPQGMYTARNPSGAYGAYQFMPQYWSTWASNAGLEGASIKDPAAQDKVAEWLMSNYYDDYRSWDLVAVAWRLGPGVANRVASEGWGALSSEERTKIVPYLGKVMPFVGTGPYMAPPTVVSPTAGGKELTPRGMFNLIAAGSQMSGTVGPSSLDYIGATSVNTQTLGDTTTPTLTDTGALESSVWGEGPEFTDTPWATSSSTGFHTLALNEERLADPAYQLIAHDTTTVIGVWLRDNLGVNVSQYRDLAVRPPGGAADSDHYWGGALDVTGSYEQMNAVANWAREYMNPLGIDYVLWQQANHYDHVHISWLPPGEGAVTEGARVLEALGLMPRQPIPENVIPSTGPSREPKVGADVGRYTVPGSVR